MPRKPKQEKQTITVIVNSKPVAAILHPPAGSRKSWYVYWNGLVASKSTGQSKYEEAVIVAENMIRNGGNRSNFQETTLSDEEFEEIQKVHFAKRKDQERSAKTLKTFRQAVTAFKAIAAMDPIRFQLPVAQATASICEAFQQKALSLPKNWRQQHPRSKKPEQVACISPNTVLKWSRALQAAFDRANREAGKRCVRSVVEEDRLLTANPWNEFRWIEGVEKAVRQFDVDELMWFLDYLEREWGGVTVATALAKTYLWSGCRQEEVTSLQWTNLRLIGSERHFEVEGKRGIMRWFRLPEGVYQELLGFRTASPFVFAAYNEQLRQFHERKSRPDRAAKVGIEFKPLCLANWLYDRLTDWSTGLESGHAHPHIFRKTALQQAWIGDNEADEKVAQDACVGKDVMMRHYVKVLREKSNRTFRRILTSLPAPVALKYGHSAQPGEGLESQLQRAIDNKDWPAVTRLLQELGACKLPSTD